MRPAITPALVLETSSFPSSLGATRSGASSKNARFSSRPGNRTVVFFISPLVSLPIP
jgi:hypothetical protein